MLKFMSSDKFDHTFSFNGGRYAYNRQPYNNAGERAVEIPIAVRFLSGFNSHKHLCEVGNVLSNYGHDPITGLRRRIIDKYEVADGVDNVDILDVSDENAYDGIVAISTVEHVSNCRSDLVGIHDIEGPLKAIAKCYDLLKLGGRGLISVPFGRLTDGRWYIQFSAEYLARLITTYGIPCNDLQVAYLKREAVELTLDNPHQRWRQATGEELAAAEYGVGFPAANGIAIINLTKTSKRSSLKESCAEPRSVFPGCLVGSVFEEPWTCHIKPEPNGYFSLGNCGPILTRSELKPQAGEYEISFAIETRGHTTISFDGRGFSEGNPPLQFPLFRYKFMGSASMLMRATLPAGLSAIELSISNEIASKGAVRVASFVVRPSRRNGNWHTAVEQLAS
jgi:hypothetical protein